jgi:hypothetical protein
MTGELNMTIYGWTILHHHVGKKNRPAMTEYLVDEDDVVTLDDSMHNTIVEFEIIHREDAVKKAKLLHNQKTELQ